MKFLRRCSLVDSIFYLGGKNNETFLRCQTWRVLWGSFFLPREFTRWLLEVKVERDSHEIDWSWNIEYLSSVISISIWFFFWKSFFFLYISTLCWVTWTHFLFIWQSSTDEYSRLDRICFPIWNIVNIFIYIFSLICSDPHSVIENSFDISFQHSSDWNFNYNAIFCRLWFFSTYTYANRLLLGLN